MRANAGDRSALITGAVLVVLASAGCSGDGSGEVPQRFAPLAQAVEAERVSLGAPGVAVAVVEKGQVTFAKGFGSKDPTAAAGAPVEPTTLFRIGSTQKALTAIALLQTVQAGAVDLDRPITSYLPNFHLSQTPEPVSQITAAPLAHAHERVTRLSRDRGSGRRDDRCRARWFSDRPLCRHWLRAVAAGRVLRVLQPRLHAGRPDRGDGDRHAVSATGARSRARDAGHESHVLLARRR